MTHKQVDDVAHTLEKIPLGVGKQLAKTVRDIEEMFNGVVAFGSLISDKLGWTHNAAIDKENAKLDYINNAIAKIKAGDRITHQNHRLGTASEPVDPPHPYYPYKHSYKYYNALSWLIKDLVDYKTGDISKSTFITRSKQHNDMLDNVKWDEAQERGAREEKYEEYAEGKEEAAADRFLYEEMNERTAHGHRANVLGAINSRHYRRHHPYGFPKWYLNDGGAHFEKDDDGPQLLPGVNKGGGHMYNDDGSVNRAYTGAGIVKNGNQYTRYADSYYNDDGSVNQAYRGAGLLPAVADVQVVEDFLTGKGGTVPGSQLAAPPVDHRISRPLLKQSYNAFGRNPVIGRTRLENAARWEQHYGEAAIPLLRRELLLLMPPAAPAAAPAPPPPPPPPQRTPRRPQPTPRRPQPTPRRPQPTPRRPQPTPRRPPPPPPPQQQQHHHHHHRHHQGRAARLEV